MTLLDLKSEKRLSKQASSAETPQKEYSPPPSYVADGNGATNGDAPLPSMRALHFLPQCQPINRGVATTHTVSTDECIAHLKLLSAFADLRVTTSTTDGLFNLSDAVAHEFPSDEEKTKALTLLREKRWSVYVQRAVDRFAVWFDKCVLTDGIGSHNGVITMDDVEKNSQYEKCTEWQSKIFWTADTMPPLDVLMVWHAYMLNPRDFLGDCIRHGKMSLWSGGMPWEIVNSCIDDANHDYKPGDNAISHFEQRTGLQWDNLNDSPLKALNCPRCDKTVNVPWEDEFTNIGVLEFPFEECVAYGDKNFSSLCHECRYIITHDKLRAAKFRRDILSLEFDGLPMPGTLLTAKGTAESKGDGYFASFFPNRLISHAILDKLLEATDPDQNLLVPSISAVRTIIETAIKSKALKAKARNRSAALIKPFEERRAFRQMMSCYWENSSPFALDLSGAVLRQGTFVEKMDNMDWIHSPALESTMGRLIQKYGDFLRIMCQNMDRVAVPTLDVDLAWHTHQLSPARYYVYSVLHTRGYYIDHDDKIDENKLSDAFEWTSKQYQRITGGKVYSECTCWYCEAVRESHNSGLFSSSSTSTARARASELHDDPGITSDPSKNPHISAHNAVRVQGHRDTYRSELKAKHLKQQYEKAVRRANKRKSGTARDSKIDPRTDAYMYPMIWGYPMMIPYYAPYAADPCITGGIYASNPSCANVSQGAVGNCISGTCGAGSGSCAGGVCSGGGGAGCSGGGGMGGCGGGGGGGGGCGGGGGGGGGC